MSIGKDRLNYDATDANTLAASDTIGAYNLDAAGNRITSTLNGAKQSLDVNVSNPLEIDVGINAADDSVASWTKDGSGNSITSTTGFLDVNLAASGVTITTSDAALANTAIKSTATPASTTAALVVATSLASRKYLTLQNLGASAVFFGDTTVTASTGLRLSNGAMLEGLRIGPAIAPKVLTLAGAADCRVMELS